MCFFFFLWLKKEKDKPGVAVAVASAQVGELPGAHNSSRHLTCHLLLFLLLKKESQNTRERDAVADMALDLLILICIKK